MLTKNVHYTFQGSMWKKRNEYEYFSPPKSPWKRFYLKENSWRGNEQNMLFNKVVIKIKWLGTLSYYDFYISFFLICFFLNKNISFFNISSSNVRFREKEGKTVSYFNRTDKEIKMMLVQTSKHGRNKKIKNFI